MPEMLSQQSPQEQPLYTKEELSEMSDAQIFKIGVKAYLQILDVHGQLETSYMAERIQKTY